MLVCKRATEFQFATSKLTISSTLIFNFKKLHQPRTKMTKSNVLLLLLGASVLVSSVFAETASEELVRLTNDYREQNGLSRIPMSYSLTKVAIIHTLDLNTNGASSVVGDCNMHSWSNKGFGLWNSCCYTPDHAQAQCMWNKPREITNGTFTGNGFENAAGGGGTISPSEALDLWKGSPGHNNVILNKEGWNTTTWRALGASACANYAVLWFSDSADPVQTSTSTLTCDSVTLPAPSNNGNTPSTTSGNTPKGSNLTSNAHVVGSAFGLISISFALLI